MTSMRRLLDVRLWACCMALLGLATQGLAQVSLQDQGSSATVEDGALTSLNRNVPGDGSADHVNDLQLEQYYVAVDGANPVSIGSLGDVSTDAQTDNSVTQSVSDGVISVSVTYTLTGNPYGYTRDGDASDDTNTVATSVTVSSADGGTHSVILYEYADLALTDIIVAANGQAIGFEPGIDEAASLTINGGTVVGATQWETQPNNPDLGGTAEITIVQRADITGDLQVTSADLAAILNAWAQNVPEGEGPDLVADGTVNAFDLAQVLSNWASNSAPSSAEVSSGGGLAGRIESGAGLSGNAAVDPGGIQTGEDIEVAFSWSRSVGPGNSLTIEKWLVVTPEPSSIALLGVGMALLAARFRRPSR